MHTYVKSEEYYHISTEPIKNRFPQKFSVPSLYRMMDDGVWAEFVEARNDYKKALDAYYQEEEERKELKAERLVELSRDLAREAGIDRLPLEEQEKLFKDVYYHQVINGFDMVVDEYLKRAKELVDDGDKW